MKFVLLVYQGSTPLPGSDRWQALSEAEQKAIYAEYAELNKTVGVAPGLPLGLPDAARTVQVRGGKTQVKQGTYLAEGVGGFSVYEAENMEAAIALAARIPAARLGARARSGPPRSTGSDESLAKGVGRKRDTVQGEHSNPHRATMPFRT